METLTDSQSDKNVLKLITAAMEDTKAENLSLLSLKKLGAFTDYLIICSASSDRQVGAIADRVISDLKQKAGLRPIGVEGVQMGHWVLIDYGHIVCHIFLNEIRDFYRLEDMWQDADTLNPGSFEEPKKVTKKKKATPKKQTAKKTEKKVATTKKAVKAPTKKAASKKPALKAKAQKKTKKAAVTKKTKKKK